MVTRNWYNFMKATRLEGVITNGLRAQDGSYHNAGYYNQSVGYEMVTMAAALRPGDVVFATNSQGIVLGSGTTPATFDDYNMESMITEGLSVSKVKKADEDNNPSYLLTITNISDAPITIGEVGILRRAYAGENVSTYKIVLMERTVMEEPLTIPAGSIGLVTYTVRMHIPEE